MLAKKKIAALSVVLAAVLVGGVFAAIILSNTLTANFEVKTEPLVLQWEGWKPTGVLYRGAWYNTSIRLQNPTPSTFDKVIVKFTITASGYTFPNGSITIQYWDGSNWRPMGIYTESWGTTILKGYFGPLTGFSVGAGYDATTQLRFMFNEGAPIAAYEFKCWAETV
ncbi:MAG: hypothetical protein ACUVUF_08935 [Candidatus Bathycorpusculaceae bacterium]